jgi:hypothetical protein
MSSCLDNTCENLESKINSHVGEIDKRLDRTNEEIKAKTKLLEIELKQQAERQDKAIKDMEQNVGQIQNKLKEPWMTEKAAHQINSENLQREIDKLKEMLAEKETNVLPHNNKTNDQITISQISTANSQVEIPTSKSSEHSCKCNCSNQDEVTSIRLSESSNNVHHGSLAIDNPLNELTLPSFENHETQVVGTFLRDLDLYFELKGIPETLKLPLVSKAITDPFTKAWLASDYYNIGSYRKFKEQIVQLLWNDQKQSNLRCKIYQDKFDKNGSETMAAHYLRYVQLAANLQPPLSEYDLIGAITAHFHYDIQKCMISANLSSTQDALQLLGKLHAMEDANQTHGKNNCELGAREMRRKEFRPGENNREENRSKYNMGRTGYETRPSNQQRSAYNQNSTWNSNLNRNDRAEGGRSHQRELNPQVPEFAPTERK